MPARRRSSCAADSARGCCPRWSRPPAAGCPSARCGTAWRRSRASPRSSRPTRPERGVPGNAKPPERTIRAPNTAPRLTTEESSMTTLTKTYATVVAARRAVEALRATGLPGARRLLRRAALDDDAVDRAVGELHKGHAIVLVNLREIAASEADARLEKIARA